MFNLRIVPYIGSYWHKLWTIRLSLLWGAISGLYAAWDAFSSLIPAPIFAALSMVMCMAIVGARVTHQPGIDE